MANDVKLRLSVDGGAQVENQLESVGAKLTNVARGAALLAAVPAFSSLASSSIQAADAITTMDNALKLATGSAKAAAQAEEALFDIAQDARVSWTELASTYGSVARAGQALGLSQERTLKVTEAIGNAMAIGGGAASSMQAALVQLGQGMASGTLRGEELNSILEQAPRLALAIADGLGVTVGELRKLGEAGELTSEKVIGALERSAPKLAKEVQNATLTVGQAFTVLSNATLKFIGEADQASGASGTLASAMSTLAGGITTVGATIREHETAFRIIAGGLGGAAAVGSIMAIGGALSTVAGAVGALGVVLAANPVVLTLLGIGAAAGAVITAGRAYSKTAEGIADSIKALEDANARSQEALGRAAGREGAQANIRREMDARTAQIKALRAELALLSNASLDTRAEDARFATAAGAATQASKARADADAYLTEVRGKLSGVDKDYQATLSRMQDLRAKGLIGEKEYAQILTDLANKTYKATDADKAAKQAHDDAARKREQAAKHAMALAEAGAKVADSLLGESASLSSEFFGKWQALNNAYSGGKIGLEKLTQAQAALLSLQPFIRDALKAENEAREKAAQWVSKQADDTAKRVDTIRAELMAQNDRNAVIGLEGVALAAVEHSRAMANVQLLREQLYMEQIAGSTPARLAALQEEIDLQTKLADARLSGATKQGAVDAAKTAADESKKFFDQMGQSLSDALMNGGKSARDYIKGLFRNMVLRPIIQGILAPVVGGLGSMVGGSAAAGTGANAISSLGSLAKLGGAGALAGLGSAFSGGAALALSGAGGTGLALSGAGAMLGSGAIGAGLAQGAGALAPWAVGGMAGLMVGKGISGGYGSNASVNVGTIAGALLGGPFGAALGGAVGGLANRAFGRKAAEATAITGTLGDDSQLQTQMLAKGGWFRSDKRWSVAADRETQGALVGGFNAVKDQAAEFAKALGGPVDTIKGYTTTVNIALTKDAKKNEEAFAAFIDAQAQKLASMAVAGMDAYARAGETQTETAARLATSLTTVNDAFLALGRSVLPLSAASGELASQIADAFGGTQAFASSVSAYMDAIYSDSEKLAAAQSALSAQFAKLGKAVPSTAAEYRALVESQDLTTDAGREMYAALVQLAPAFAQVNQAVAGTVSELQSAGESIADEIKRIRGATGTGKDARTAFAIATAQARAGDKSAAESLPGLSKALIDMAQQTSTSAEEFAVVQAATAASLEETLRVLKGLGVSVPGFATGGSFSGGLRLVGENGPELEVTGPSRIYSASQTASMLGGGASADEIRALVDEVRAMRQDLQQGQAVIAGNTGRVARVFDRVARDDALMTRAAT